MEMTDLAPGESSHIVAYGYDHQTETLSIRFKNGDIWLYNPVTPFMYEGFRNADSKGSYLHSVIRQSCGNGEKQPAEE